MKQIEPKITMHFGGGSLYLKCHSCASTKDENGRNYSGEFAAEELDFPGTPEQQKEPRRKLEEKKQKHLADFHVIQ